MKISGDLLLLHHVVDSETSENMWVWTGGYLKSLSPVPNANISTRKVVELTVQGLLIKPVNPSIVIASKHLPNERCAEVNSQDITWVLKEDVLEAAHQQNTSSLPRFVQVCTVATAAYSATARSPPVQFIHSHLQSFYSISQPIYSIATVNPQ